MLLSARVAEEWRGKGIGRQLVQTAAGLVVRRDIRALEAVGTYTDGPSCMLPTGWLEAVGFAVVRPHPVTPRLRMDLQSSLRWADLGAAWHRLAGLVSAPPAPGTRLVRPARGGRAVPVTDPARPTSRIDLPSRPQTSSWCSASSR